MEKVPGLHRINTCDSGFPESLGSENSNTSSCLDLLGEDINMKDLIMMNKVLNSNDMIEEKPVRNGMKTYELNSFDKGGMLQNGNNNILLEKPLLERENSDLSEKSGSTDSSQHVTMKKRVGLLSGVALIVGTMIGSGIFVTPKGVLASSGSVGLSLIVWLACGILALFGTYLYFAASAVRLKMKHYM